MIRTWWSGCALASVILIGCGDGDRAGLASSTRPEVDAGQGEDPTEPGSGDASAQSPSDTDAGDASAQTPADAGANPAKTALAPVEAPFGGQTQTARSGHYQMISRVAAPIGSAAAGEGTDYRMLTGVVALQGESDQ